MRNMRSSCDRSVCPCNHYHLKEPTYEQNNHALMDDSTTMANDSSRMKGPLAPLAPSRWALCSTSVQGLLDSDLEMKWQQSCEGVDTHYGGVSSLPPSGVRFIRLDLRLRATGYSLDVFTTASVMNVSVYLLAMIDTRGNAVIRHAVIGSHATSA